MQKWLIGIIMSLLALPAMAYEPLVEKKVFELPVYETLGGKTIKNVKVGWESYGTLNAAKDNAILICHYFSGNSHAAGRYTTADKRPGYWDAIIGSGRPVDTDKFFVLSVDSLVNLGTGNPMVTTTGPASIDPATGKPYGLGFPVVTIRDFVNVQKALLESLGIERLHAVMGASMGALQTYEWASAYPDRVSRALPVIGAGWASGNLIAWLNVWAAPIRLDPKWNGGNYYDGEPPLRGLAEALKIVTLQAQHWEWVNGNFGRAWAQADMDPAAAFDNQYKIETVLDGAGLARAQVSDANHFLYLVKANQLFLAGHGQSYVEGLQKIKAPTLIIHSDEDLVFFPEEVRETAAYIRTGGAQVDIVELQGTRGHLDGVLSIGQAGAQIKAFLED